MDAVRESSQELMARLVQTLLDEGVTAQTFDLEAMPFAAMEQLGHGVGKVLARQIQVALAEAQAARIREQHGDEHACPHCGQLCRAVPQPRTMQTLDGEVEFREPKCVCASCRKSFFPSA
jgi:hypothetical protein